MTIRKTSKPCIGGATPKRDRADLATDDRSVESFSDRTKSGFRLRSVRDVCGEILKLSVLAALVRFKDSQEPPCQSTRAVHAKMNGNPQVSISNRRERLFATLDDVIAS